MSQIPTPITDAATHDDWSDGAEAVEPEVSRTLECSLVQMTAERDAALRSSALSKNGAIKMTSERDAALASNKALREALDRWINATDAKLEADADWHCNQSGPNTQRLELATVEEYDAMVSARKALASAPVTPDAKEET